MCRIPEKNHGSSVVCLQGFITFTDRIIKILINKVKTEKDSITKLYILQKSRQTNENPEHMQDT